MFCKNCGKEIEDEAAFCPKCGKAVEESAVKNDEPSSETEGGQFVQEENPVKKTAENASAVMEKTNPVYIVGIILSIFSIIFFILAEFSYVLVYDEWIFKTTSIAGLCVSIYGYYMARKKKQKGKMLAVIGMTVCAVMSLMAIFATL